MKRHLAQISALLLLAVLVLPWFVQAQTPALRVIITDSTGNHAASVSGGNLGTVGSASGGDAVNVFHQSTIRHISGSVHIGGTIGGAQFHVQGLGVPGQAHGGVLSIQGITGMVPLNVDCSNCSSAATVTVSHIASALHIGGTINGAQLHIQGLGIPGQAHGGVLTIQGITGGISVPISGAVTVSSGTVSATQSGAWNVSAAQSGAFMVQAAHQAGEWNVRHVSGSLHIAGTIKGAQFHVTGLGTPGQSHGGVFTIQGVTGMLPVTVDTGSTANLFRVAHISSATHISGTANAGAIHVAGISNVGSGAPGGSTTPMACHTTVAFSTTADLVLAHSQNSWRIYVCSVILVAAGAESVSIVEGTGTTCGTTTRGIIGGFGGTMSLAANGGFSAISPFPFISSSVNGNQICLDKSGSGNVSGSITYRGSP